MRLLFKILSLPFILITWVLYGMCRLIVLISGMIFGIMAGLALIAAIVLFVKVDVMTGAILLTVAFLISPYGIPKLAAWLTGKLGGLNYALRDFVMS